MAEVSNKLNVEYVDGPRNSTLLFYKTNISDLKFVFYPKNVIKTSTTCTSNFCCKSFFST